MVIDFSVCIPIYNGGALWKAALSSLLDAVGSERVIVVDSSSTDGSGDYAKLKGVHVEVIPPAEFNHGRTRNVLASIAKARGAEVVVFMTQDAIIDSPNAIAAILNEFLDGAVGAVCGRQLPHLDANPIAQHARYFNYPEDSFVRTYDDKDKFGIKSVFMSNSFSAYRLNALTQVGLFPSKTILCEDMYVAAKMLLEGFTCKYCSLASVRHSHNYSPKDEFKRYFDIGVFHVSEPWIQERFGEAGGEGKRFVISELKYLTSASPQFIPLAVLNTLAKYLGYKLGRGYKHLPLSWVRAFSMHRRFWDS